MFKVKILGDKETAIKVGQFLTGPNAFEQTWAPNEKAKEEQIILNYFEIDSGRGQNDIGKDSIVRFARSRMTLQSIKENARIRERSRPSAG